MNPLTFTYILSSALIYKLSKSRIILLQYFLKMRYTSKKLMNEVLIRSILSNPVNLSKWIYSECSIFNLMIVRLFERNRTSTTIIKFLCICTFLV